MWLLLNWVSFSNFYVRLAQEKLYGRMVRHETYFNHPIVFILDGQAIEDCIMKLGNLRPPMAIIAAYRQTQMKRFGTVGIVNS